jgi:hypothetical protein
MGYIELALAGISIFTRITEAFASAAARAAKENRDITPEEWAALKAQREAANAEWASLAPAKP